MTRILFFGDAAATGFGSVTRDLGLALLARGADLRFVSQNDLGSGLQEPFRSRTVDLSWLINTADGPIGMRDFIPNLLRGEAEVTLADGSGWEAWKPDACILLGDYRAASIMLAPYLADFAALPSFHYMPVEGTDLPPSWAEMWRSVKPVAMSRFGQLEIAKVTGQVPPLAYHGVDTETFHPVSPSNPIRVEYEGEKSVLTSKDACKQWLGINPRARVIFRMDRHMPRKQYNGLIRALVPVLEERVDTVALFHCGLFDQGGHMSDTLSKVPLHIRQRFRVTNAPGVTREVLATMYNAADVYVSAGAEGFGLTIAEAIACGVPAVGVDYSAVPEVIGPAGVVVPYAYLFDNEYDHLWCAPDEKALGEAVAWFLDHPAKARATGAMGPRHVRSTFTWEACAEVFMRAIEDAQAADTTALPPESEDFVYQVPVAA